MAGEYTGTCKAVGESDDLPPKECRVDFILSPSGVFRVTITSCDGYSAPSHAHGMMLRSVSRLEWTHAWIAVRARVEVCVFRLGWIRLWMAECLQVTVIYVGRAEEEGGISTLLDAVSQRHP